MTEDDQISKIIRANPERFFGQPTIAVDADGCKHADWSKVPTREQQCEWIGIKPAQIDAVAKAICDSVEADNYDGLHEGSFAKDMYRQQARDMILAYEKSKA